MIADLTDGELHKVLASTRDLIEDAGPTAAEHEVAELRRVADELEAEIDKRGAR